MSLAPLHIVAVCVNRIGTRRGLELRWPPPQRSSEVWFSWIIRGFPGTLASFPIPAFRRHLLHFGKHFSATPRQSCLYAPRQNAARTAREPRAGLQVFADRALWNVAAAGSGMRPVIFDLKGGVLIPCFAHERARAPISCQSRKSVLSSFPYAPTENALVRRTCPNPPARSLP